MGFGVWGLGVRVWGLRFEVWGLGIRVWGLGLEVEVVKVWVSGNDSAPAAAYSLRQLTFS